jgi:hypothetical protein
MGYLELWIGSPGTIIHPSKPEESAPCECLNDLPLVAFHGLG